MSEHFIIYDLSTGSQCWRGNGPEGIAAQQLPFLSSGLAVLVVSAASYELPLENIHPDEIRASLWQQVKAKRAAVRDGGAATPLGAVDSQETEDVPARTNILGATFAAMIAKMNAVDYSTTWTMLDNSELALDADQMISVGLAVLAHVNACYDRARALRNQIDAAEDVETLLKIDIGEGWPQ